MTENVEKITAGAKTANFLEKNKKGLVTVLVTVIVLLAGYIVFANVTTKGSLKNLEKVDAISYELTNGSAGLEADELNARKASALEKLAAYTSKGGVAGVRANLLCAEIAYSQEKYEDAVVYWKKAAAAGKKSYTAPLAYFNMAAAYENLNKLDDAAASYKLAADSKDFVMKTHAEYNYGRVLETQGKYAEAVAVYNALNDEMPDDTWAKLAKTRVIALQVAGKAE